MKSADNEGVVQNRLQVHLIHVFLVAPLGACHVAQPLANQYQRGVPSGKRHPHAGVRIEVSLMT